jgi:hypothetical protein
VHSNTSKQALPISILLHYRLAESLPMQHDRNKFTVFTSSHTRIYTFQAPLNMKKWFLVGMDVCLTGAWTIGWVSFIFSIQEFIYHRQVPRNTNFLASKIRALWMGSKIKMAIFLKVARTILIKFLYFMGTIFLNKSTSVASSGK